MSDRAYASIKIGGKISRSDLKALLDAAENDGAGGPDYESVDREALEEIAEETSAAKLPLYFGAAEMRGAMFDELEEECCNLGLTYLRHSEAYPGSWDDTLEFWEPGMAKDEVIEYACSSDGEPMLSLSQLEDATAHSTLMTRLAEMRRIATFPFVFEIVG